MCEACIEKLSSPLADLIEATLLHDPLFVTSLTALHRTAGGEISTLALVGGLETFAGRLRGRLEEVRKTRGKKGKDRTSPGPGVVDAVLDQIVGREWEKQEQGKGENR